MTVISGSYEKQCSCEAVPMKDEIHFMFAENPVIHRIAEPVRRVVTSHLSSETGY